MYWGNFGSTTIGRANLNGTGVTQSFISGAEAPCGVAVDVLPSNTTISKAKIKAKKRIATFSFTADQATGFQCALVKPKKKSKKKGKHQKKPKVKFSSCSSPKTYQAPEAGQEHVPGSRRQLSGHRPQPGDQEVQDLTLRHA